MIAPLECIPAQITHSVDAFSKSKEAKKQCTSLVTLCPFDMPRPPKDHMYRWSTLQLRRSQLSLKWHSRTLLAYLTMSRISADFQIRQGHRIELVVQ